MACKLAGIAVEREANYQSLTKHSLAFENISDAVVLTDNEGKITEWSPSAERLFKFKKGEILGKKIQDAPFIQHSQGLPKQISLQNNFVEYVGGNVVQYVTSTLPGSSGSPVFNDAWEVVAIHHSGGNIPEPTTQKQYSRNEGILIESILSDIPVELRELISKTANTQSN